MNTREVTCVASSDWPVRSIVCQQVVFATLHPSAPVIDSVVLRNLGLRLPPANAPDRMSRIVELYSRLSSLSALWPFDFAQGHPERNRGMVGASG
jgi:hypothetical protein